MNKEITPQIGNAINFICNGFNISYKEFLLHQAELARLDAVQNTHPGVKSLLEVMAEDLEHASFNFYASFK